MIVSTRLGQLLLVQALASGLLRLSPNLNIYSMQMFFSL